MTILHLAVDRSARAPLHRQVYEQLRRAILEGRLRSGQRVPSTRTLAVEIGISRLPVLTAYEQLRHEGYLAGRTGSGTYVSGALPDAFLRTPATAVRPQPRRIVPREQDYGGLRPFRVSVPALDLFPHALWARLVSRRARAMPASRMAYGDPAGVSRLRVAIADHLRAARGVRCDAGQVLIVGGSQVALHLCAAALLARTDRLAVEEPGYPGARAALAAGGARLVPVPVDEDGIDVAALERHPRVRAVYVTPAHQYPLGMAMSASRRLALLDWARRHDAWVIEDDYDSEFRYVSRPLGTLQGLDTHDRVVYVGTFSKVLFPALRVGFLVVPSSHFDRFVQVRTAFDLFPPTLNQLALAEFLREGHFARHLRRMRGAYAERRAALLRGLARHCGDRLTVRNADAGLHLAAFLSRGLDDGDIVRQMASRGLTATPLSSCYAGVRARQGLLLGFGGAPPRRLFDATAVLGDILHTG
jgi:GntR family transcriptional regulator/MocR family aminotransferase